MRHRPRPFVGGVLLAAALMFNCADTTTFSDTGLLPADGGQPSPDTGPTCPEVPCGEGMICHRGACIVDWGACQRNETCYGDTYCEQPDGRCLPYAEPGSSGSEAPSHDPECHQGRFSPDRFEPPVVRCNYTKAASLSTPLVIDLDDDAKPEIVFVSYAKGAVGGWLIALSGEDCKKELFVVDAGLGPRSQIAAAQLSGDPRPEIVGVDQLNRIVVFDAQGGLLATSPVPAPSGSLNSDGGPAIADLDGASPPEIIYGGMALRLEGAELKVLYENPVEGGHWGTLSTVADVDLDGVPELVAGNRIFDGPTGAEETPAEIAKLPGGYPAVVQWDKSTPEPEIVLVSSRANEPAAIRIYHPKTGKIVFGPVVFGDRYGGPPTVADFDGDGEPEVGVAGTVSYQVFDGECAAKPLPAHCHSLGVRWRKKTRDASSGSTGSSVFDFNADGEAEVVYRDECWLRAYDGHTGKVRFAHQVTSGTILELPVIADVDADGHAELVVSSHELPDACEDEPDLGLSASVGGTRGIIILADAKNRWAPSRTIWNQHTYHVTNVGTDGVVPSPEPRSWESYNSFRQNIQGEAASSKPAADLTGGQAPALEPESCAERWPLSARICNRGAKQAPAGITGAFYEADPREPGAAEKQLCAAKTTKPLEPGECEVIQCDWPKPPEGSVDLWFVADDEGDSRRSDGLVVECREDNNLLFLPKAACRPLR